MTARQKGPPMEPSVPHVTPPPVPEFAERRLRISAAQLAMVRAFDAAVNAAGRDFRVCVETLLAGHGIAAAQIVGTDDVGGPVLIVRVPANRKKAKAPDG